MRHSPSSSKSNFSACHGCMLQILPFAVLLGGIFAFWRLSRSSELVVARAAGISAWQFLAMPVLLAMLLGIVRHRCDQPAFRHHVRPRREPLQRLSPGRRRAAFAQWRPALGAPGRFRPDAEWRRDSARRRRDVAQKCAECRPCERAPARRPDHAAAAAGGRARDAQCRHLGPQPGQRAGAGCGAAAVAPWSTFRPT